MKHENNFDSKQSDNILKELKYDDFMDTRKFSSVSKIDFDQIMDFHDDHLDDILKEGVSKEDYYEIESKSIDSQLSLKKRSKTNIAYTLYNS